MSLFLWSWCWRRSAYGLPIERRCKGEAMTVDTIRVWDLRLFLGLVLVFAVSWSDSKRYSSSNQREMTNTAKSKARAVTDAESQAMFLAVGDIMLSRGVNRVIDREKDKLLPFSQLADLLGSADFNFGNLESPISGNDNREGRGLVFNTHKHDVVGLIKYKFKIVNLANNHALDQGVAGLRHTRVVLSKLGIEQIGVGENKKEAWQGKVITANAIRFGFVAASYSSINDGGATTNQYVARIEDHEYLREAIKRLKLESDLIIVAMHAGVEYTRRPHGSQIGFARAAIDAGADIVIGTHPHWIQTIEQYQGKYIFYSLGNFIFDQRIPDTEKGLMLRVIARRVPTEGSNNYRVYIDRIELIPVVIERVGVPRRATQNEMESIFRKVGVKGPILTMGAD